MAFSRERQRDKSEDSTLSEATREMLVLLGRPIRKRAGAEAGLTIAEHRPGANESWVGAPKPR